MYVHADLLREGPISLVWEEIARGDSNLKLPINASNVRTQQMQPAAATLG